MEFYCEAEPEVNYSGDGGPGTSAALGWSMDPSGERRIRLSTEYKSAVERYAWARKEFASQSTHTVSPEDLVKFEALVEHCHQDCERIRAEILAPYK